MYTTLDGKYPKGDKIRLVLDNLKVHKSEKVQKYISSVPGRFEFVFTPKHASWLNLVEGFFSKMTRQMLKGIRVETKDELVTRIYKYFEEINEEPVVYKWGWHLDDIDPTEKVFLICELLDYPKQGGFYLPLDICRQVFLGTLYNRHYCEFL